MGKVVVFLALLAAAFAAHNCIHDKLDVPLRRIDTGSSDFMPDEDNRVLQTYQSIRIYADYTYLTSGNSIIREYIRNQLMPSAIGYYQSTLSVIRSASNIRFTDSCGDLPAPNYIQSTGVTADLIILVTAEDSSESYLAYALPCALAKTNDRPVYGMINFNFRHLQTATNVQLEENLITTLHEMAHVLGFSSNLYEYYRNPTTGSYVNPQRSKVVNGISVSYIAVEPLTTKLRNYFGCSTLEGAYLENEGSSGSAGSHFERKVFANEFMTASSIADSVISEFTLALLEGTGWYKVSYSNVEPFSWGKGKGCTFLDGACVSSGAANFPEFCSRLEAEGCTYTSRAIGFCGATSIVSDSSLVSQFNYWGNKTIVLDTFSDNCPYYIAYPNLDCEDPNNKNYATLTSEIYGVNSRCFPGTLSTVSSSRRTTGYCFAVNCTTSGASSVLTVTIGSQTVTCSAAGSISVPGFLGTLQCPDPVSFCNNSNPVYCERGCSGRGTCLNGKCQCPTGWAGADCGFRTYIDGCARCASSSSNTTSCFGDGCACNPTSKNCTGAALIGFGDGGVARTTEKASAALVQTSLGVISLIIFALGI